MEELTQDGIDTIREEVQQFIADPDSDEGQEVINNDKTHVAEVWEDGEITTTKSGDLYRHRSLHGAERPVWPDGMEVLFDVPDGQDHKRMIVTDRDGLEAFLDEYR